MTYEKWLFIGTDARLARCKFEISREGKQCQHIATNTLTDELTDMLRHFQPSHIVFSIGQFEQLIPAALVAYKPKVYVGNASKEWLESFKEAGVSLYFYLQEEQFIWENAHLTAEAFLQEFYALTNRMVNRQRFYVAGFGRVGKMVARLLAGLGGDVTILTQSAEQLAEAKMLGYTSHSLYSPALFKGAYVVNTIPAEWFTPTDDEPLFLFDLASAPGCLSVSETLEYYKLLPRLPGKHFPIDAADVLKDALNRLN